MIVLVGFMGAGKTTVGQILAHRLDLPFKDTDALLVERTGSSISDIFSGQGEPAFREIEREVVAEVLAGEEAVVSLGGGALTDPRTEEELQGCTVIHLLVDLDEALRRVGGDGERPLLSGDVRGLYGRRLGAYQVAADDVIQTDDLTPNEAVEEILRRLRLTRAVEPDLQSPDVEEVPPVRETTLIRVAAPSRHYDVIVGADLIDRTAEYLFAPDDAEKAFVVTHPSLLEFAGRVAKSYEAQGLEAIVIEVPEGEHSKSVSAAARSYDLMNSERATRHDLVVGVGGGVVTDLAGFVASTFNRGMEVAHVPTTLLGQVDAAVGGKTAVNLAEAKNKVGTFHQPVGVLCDVETLQSLPDEEMASGLAEVVKYGLIADGWLLETVLHDADRLVRREAGLLCDVVAHSVAVKAEIVAEDEKDSGRRAVLNYGHTIGHAIESISEYRAFRHGEAIALGMMGASYIAQEMWGTSDDLVSAHSDALSAAGLPTSTALDPDAIEEALARDKKYRRGVRFVLLREPARPETDVLVPTDVLRRSIERLGT
jgi:3-dehydroquinate synthase/shikimate kinase/3-dehydroquinate synthase